jgi:hypothetical protein
MKFIIREILFTLTYFCDGDDRDFVSPAFHLGAFFFSFLFDGTSVLNPGLHACYAGTLLLELHTQPLFFWVFLLL